MPVPFVMHSGGQFLAAHSPASDRCKPRHGALDDGRGLAGVHGHQQHIAVRRPDAGDLGPCGAVLQVSCLGARRDGQPDNGVQLLNEAGAVRAGAALRCAAHAASAASRRLMNSVPPVAVANRRRTTSPIVASEGCT